MKKYINLLPPEYQKQRKVVDVNLQLLNFGIWLVISLAVFGALCFVAQIFLKSSRESLSQVIQLKSEELQNLQRSSIENNIQAINDDLSNFSLIKKDHIEWADSLEEFARLLPKDVTVDSLKITRSSGKIEAAGRAGSRDSVLQLRQNILASSYFRNVDFPLTNLQKPKDTPWKFKFYLRQQPK